MKTAIDDNAAWEIEHRFDGPHGWIQWKGTSVCMDVHCECGNLSHVDAEFCYAVKCQACGAVYHCNGHIEFIKLEKEPSGGAVIAESMKDSV